MRRVLVLCTVLVTVLSLTVPAVAQPSNDDLTGATDVVGLPFDEVVDTTEATTEPNEPTEGEEFCPPRGSTVWYALTLDEGQEVRIDTAGSDYDTTLAVYTGSDYTDLSLVDCNDDTLLGLQAALTISVDGGVTYLVQVGSFGGDGGGQLEISIDEPGKATGKPLIFKSRFKGLVADAYNEDYDESTGAYSSSSATLVDGQSNEGGKPSRYTYLFVSEYSESFDEVTESFSFTEWSGIAEPSRDQYEMDKKLRSASVITELTLFGQTCTFVGEEAEPECTDLGPADVTVDLTWDGFGGLSKDKFKEMSTSDGTRFMSRGSVSSRNANVSGGWNGDHAADLTGGFGQLSNQAAGDFVMFRG